MLTAAKIIFYIVKRKIVSCLFQDPVILVKSLFQFDFVFVTEIRFASSAFCKESQLAK